MKKNEQLFQIEEDLKTGKLSTKMIMAWTFLL